jgi:outer membrane lipoprotein-sorting protein
MRALAAFALLLSAPAIFAQAPTLDQVLAKHYEAQGGLPKLRAVKSMRVTLKMSSGSMEFPIVIEAKRPNSIRTEVTIQGNAIISAFDGKNGWSINPFQSAKKEPEPMTPEELRQIEAEADIDGPLIDWKPKGHLVELQGKEPVEGSDAFKLKVTLKNGDVRYIYLDTDSYLQVKTTSKRKVRDTEIEGEQLLGNYKEVGGLMMAHSIDAGATGVPQRQKMTVEKIEFNVPIDDLRFKMPEKPAAPPAPAPAKKVEPAAPKK